MAKKKKKTKSSKEVTKQSYDVFTNPTETLLGKIIVGIIIFGTIALIFISVIIMLIDFF